MKLSVPGMKKRFNKLCNPSQFYLVLSLIGLAIYLANMLEHKNKMNTASGLVIQAVVVVVWTFMLNWVCSAKYGEEIAWVLVFLPFIMFLGILIVIYHMMDEMDLSKDDLLKIINDAKKDEADTKLDSKPKQA